jgi:hypothetical protein
LRNPELPEVAQQIREQVGCEVFDDWYAAGPRADDHWKEYEQGRGRTFEEALKGRASRSVVTFDRTNLDRADAVVLLMPAGKSGHMELGRSLGKDLRCCVCLETEPTKRLDGWDWFTGLYEGEGYITRNGKVNGHGVQMGITMRDFDVLQRTREIVGVGKVYGPYKGKQKHHSDMYRWQITNMPEALYVARGLYPDVSVRRKEQFDRVLLEAGQEDWKTGPSPYDYRWDQMLGLVFDTTKPGAVVRGVNQLITTLITWKADMEKNR